MRKTGSGRFWVRSGKKYIFDYPILHRMLANLFHETHLLAVAGASPKYGFMGGRLVQSPLPSNTFDLDFWRQTIGSYLIQASFVSEFGITLDVKTEYARDIFFPDTFVLMTTEATFNISVSDRGALQCIEMIFEHGMPEFGRDLLRDFPDHNAKSDKVLNYLLTRKLTLPPKVLLSGTHFREVTTIEV